MGRAYWMRWGSLGKRESGNIFRLKFHHGKRTPPCCLGWKSALCRRWKPHRMGPLTGSCGVAGCKHPPPRLRQLSFSMHTTHRRPIAACTSASLLEFGICPLTGCHTGGDSRFRPLWLSGKAEYASASVCLIQRCRSRCPNVTLDADSSVTWSYQLQPCIHKTTKPTSWPVPAVLGCHHKF